MKKPNSYDYSIVEKDKSSFWINLASQFGEKFIDRRNYTIIMPPPNVTGNLHIGHVLCYTIIDSFIRHAAFSGYNVLFQSGFDHAGISTQLVVQRKNDYKLRGEELINAIFDQVDESKKNIQFQMNQLGLFIDWSRLKFTMDEQHSSAVIKTFVKLYSKGLIYKARRLVNWDTVFKTAISDLEVEFKQEKGYMYYIPYDIYGCSEKIVVGTTRPETLFADVALAVNPKDERYKHLIGKSAFLPYTQRSIPIVSHESIVIEKGTGVLKITPGHSYEDYKIGNDLNLNILSILDNDGKLCGDYVPERFQGLSCKEVRKIVGEEKSIKTEEIVHQVPYCDRSKVIMEPRITDQWFVNMQPLVTKMKEVVNNGSIPFFPEHLISSYNNWLNNIEPWCISRQILWGHRIPVWYDESNNIYVGENEEQVRKEYKISKSTVLRQETDVLDTWFSSSIFHMTALEWPRENFQNRYPSDILITGYDILFFWVTKMIFMSMALHDEKNQPEYPNLAFKKVLFHTLVRDEHGKKMSKTLNNVQNPSDLIEKHGADALRLGLLFGMSLKNDVKFSHSKIVTAEKLIQKIWNSYTFVKMKINEIDEKCNTEIQYDDLMKNFDKMNIFSQWILIQSKETYMAFLEAMENLNIDLAIQTAYHFFWNTFCDYFIEWFKNFNKEECDLKLSLHVLIFVFKLILQLFHLFIPYITEHIWMDFSNNNNVSILESKYFFMDKNSQIAKETYENINNNVNDLINLTYNIRFLKKEITARNFDVKYGGKINNNYIRHNIHDLSVVLKMNNIISKEDNEIIDHSFEIQTDFSNWNIENMQFDMTLLTKIHSKLKSEINLINEFIENNIKNENISNNIIQKRKSEVLELQKKKKLLIIY